MDQPLRPHTAARLGRLGLLLPALALTVLLTAAGPVSPPDPGRSPAPADASAAGADAVRAVATRAMAAVLVATKTDNRAAGDAVAGGGTVNYTVTLANTGDADATNVSFSDTIDPNSTLAGAVRVSPLAFPDAYGFLSGATLSVMAGTGLLANDFAGAPAAPVTAFSLDDFATSHAAGTSATVGADGSLTVNADGSFTFQPPTGFVGAFTFDYRLANTAGTDTAEVTLTAAPPVAPTAADDGPAPNSAPGDDYHTAFDTPFALAAPGVLMNDGLGTPTAALTSFGGGTLGGTVTDHAAGSNVALGGGGSLQVGADGAVAFTPPAGFTGPFTFQYRLTNAAGTSDATVTIAVGARPAAADDAYPYVLVGNVGVNTATSSGFSVAANDAGDGATLTVTSTSNGTAVLDPSGTFTFEPAPGYEGPAGFTYDLTNGFGTVSATVSLSVSEMIWFIDNEAAAGVGTLTSPFNSVAAFNAVNDGGSGHPGAGDHVFLYERAAPYDGPLTLLNGQVVVGQDATASLAAIVGVAPPPDSPALPATDAGNAATTTLGGVSGGVVVAQNNALYGFTAAPTGGAGISGSGFGTLTVDDVTVNATGGPALVLTNGSLDAAFDGVSSTGGTHGVALTGVGGSADLGGGSLSGSTTAGFLVSGGNATLSYAGSITNTAGRSVSATSRTGGTLTLSGAIADTGAGLLVQNNAGGSVAFTGSPVAVTTTGTDGGVTLANNTGSTVTFSGGGLAVATDDGNGFDATGGGLVVVSGAGNTLASTGGVALNVVNTSIGGVGLTFQSVSADGGSNGIVLSSTGVAGGLTVTGAGTAGSGGTIQNVAGADGAAAGNGVYLADTRGVSLTEMDVQGTANNGVFGTGVRGLAMDEMRFTGTHGTSASSAFAESAVHLVDAGGAVAVTNSQLDGGAFNALRVSNTTGSAPTLDSLVVADNTVSTMQGSVADPRDSALRVVIGDGTADVRVRDNVVSYWWANAVYVTALGTGSATARITGNTAHQTSGALAGAGGLWVNGGDLAFDISGNSVRGANGTAISADRLAVGPLMEGTIANNAVGASGVPNSGSATGIGIFASHHGTGTTTVRIDGNTVRQINGSANGAITTVTGDAATFGGSGTMNATITANDIRESGTTVSGAQHAILVTHGVTATAPGDSDIGCYDILGNTVINFNSGSAATAQNRLRVNQRFSTTSRFPGYAGPATGAASNTALAAYLLGRNTASNSLNANTSTGGFLDTVPPGSPCPQPSALRFAVGEAVPQAPTVATPTPDLLGAVRTAPLDRLAGREVAPVMIDVPEAGLTASADGAEAARMAVEAEAATAASLLPPEVQVAIGTLPAGKSVTILFDVTVNNPVPPASTHLSNQGTATADGGLSVVTNDPDTPAANDPTLTLLSHDTAGPVTTNVTATPNPALVNTAVVLTASVSDAATGGSTIASAAYSVNGGAYQAMAAADGAFDEVTEDVTAALGTFATAGVRQVCVRGTDAAANTGAPSCVTLAVYNPAAGHVTGAGWFNSPAGAYVANPGFTGKSHVTFQARYQNNATVPTGQTRFWLQGQSFTFESTAYDWLVISGARLQIQGSGKVNNAGDYGFMLTAIDGGEPGGGGVNRFRIRIWNRNAGNAVVYDNQVGPGCTDTSDTAVPCTVHSHGSIQIHNNGGGNGNRGVDGEPAPEEFSFQPPMPNPSRGQAFFRFGLPEAADVEIVVFDVLGREVARLADEELEAGWHVVTLDGVALPSGAYFARMRAGTFVETQRLTIAR